jgi:hypothetical protein
MGIEKGEEVQAKVMPNIVNKIIAENFPNLEKELLIQVQEYPGHQTNLIKNKTSPWHFIIRTTSTENRQRILNTVRQIKQITYKGKSIKITANFSRKTLKAGRAQSEVF